MALPVKLYVTYRSEYLVLRDLCVAVRDRASGAWQPLHSATCAHVLGPVGSPDAEPREALPVRVGERLCFYAAARRIATGAIVAIEEPTRALLCEADRQWEQVFRPSDPRHTAIMLAMKSL
jgi:hypothetical protein